MGIAKKKRTRVKVKQKRPKTLKKLIIEDEKIRSKWDPKLTLQQNYKRLGLNVGEFKVNTTEELDKVFHGVPIPEVVDAPGAEQEPEPEPQPAEKTIFEELFPDPGPQPKRVPKLSEGELQYYKRLYEKHGTDFKAMARDIKLNFYQHAPGMLKKKITIYVERYKDSKPLGKAHALKPQMPIVKGRPRKRNL